MSLNLRSNRIPALGAFAVAALSALAMTGGSAATASGTRACPIDQDGDIVYLPDNSGNVYYIRVTNTSCAVGNKVVRGYFHCRRANGRNGRCRKQVVRFTCTETKRRYTVLDGQRLDFRAIVTCRKGSQRVVHAYRQVLKGSG
jgi:hypothetical protein